MTVRTTAPTYAAPAGLADMAHALATAPGEWIRRVRLSTEGRWYERLHLDDDHEIWLISWLSGQSTGLHDHGCSRGAFAVALGSLREHDLTRSRDLGPGEVRAFGPDHIHEVENATAAPAVSVHVYSPPLTVMNRYDRTASGLIKLAEERSDQW